MIVFASRLGLAFALAALCPGGRTAHAQAAPVTYWTPNWPIGLGGVGDSSNTYGNFPGLDARSGGVSNTRYNFSNGWFVGSESGGMGLGLGLSMSDINQGGAFGNTRAPYYEGMQFGYNFQNAPLRIFGGVDTLKYNSAGIGNPFTSFDSTSGTVPGYRAHAGVEFQPTPNLSLSLGFGYTQLPGRIDSDINSLALPGASPFVVNGRR